MSLNSGWETVGGAGKPIKKVGSSKQVAKLEAEAKKKFAEKPLRLEEVRKLNKFWDISGFIRPKPCWNFFGTSPTRLRAIRLMSCSVSFRKGQNGEGYA